MKRWVLVGLAVSTALLSGACLAFSPVRTLTPQPGRVVEPVASVAPLLPTHEVLPTATDSPSLSPTQTDQPDACAEGECINACFNQLPAVTKARKTSNRSVDQEDGYTLVTYTIAGDQIRDPLEGSDFPTWLKPAQQDKVSQHKIWKFFAALIPLEQRRYLSEYRVFSDGEDNILASVAQSQSDPNRWALEVDILDASNPQDLTTTLIHEYGHLLTLNPSQMVASQAIFDNPDDNDLYQREMDACPTYFPGEGCSNPDSYLNAFYLKFWPDLESEWAAIDAIEDEDEYTARLEEFYTRYQDQFVSDYAPTNPSEDISESFAAFVLQPKPTGDSIADQKVLFFYAYPELVGLRLQIGRGLCAQLNP